MVYADRSEGYIAERSEVHQPAPGGGTQLICTTHVERRRVSIWAVDEAPVAMGVQSDRILDGKRYVKSSKHYVETGRAVAFAAGKDPCRNGGSCTMFSMGKCYSCVQA